MLRKHEQKNSKHLKSKTPATLLNNINQDLCLKPSSRNHTNNTNKQDSDPEVGEAVAKPRIEEDE